MPSVGQSIHGHQQPTDEITAHLKRCSIHHVGGPVLQVVFHLHPVGCLSYLMRVAERVASRAKH